MTACIFSGPSPSVCLVYLGCAWPFIPTEHTGIFQLKVDKDRSIDRNVSGFEGWRDFGEPVADCIAVGGVESEQAHEEQC